MVVRLNLTVEVYSNSTCVKRYTYVNIVSRTILLQNREFAVNLIEKIRKKFIFEEMAQHTPIFRDLNADDADPETTEIESCCMNCYENVMKNTICYLPLPSPEISINNT